MTNKNPFSRPTLPDSQETQSDRATKQTNAFSEATRVSGQTVYDQYPAEGAILNNRYKLLEKIGQGGMGQVYKALDIAASNARSQQVFRAIKILSPALIGNEREILRLQIEAMNAQELTHENIIRVHHFDTDSEHIYLIMEWLDGKSFNDLLTPPNHHGIAFSELKPYLPAIAKALDYAHRKNIIHRDIKPSNLFLTNDNRVVVIDFGVSYAINESQSRFSETSGTPPYRPPEALVGGHQSGARDDVYALAVTLYELLMGDLPYKGELISSRNADSPKPRKPDSLSQAQWQVLFNAFYFEPSKRPQSVGSFIAELCAVENSLESEQKAEAEVKRKAEVEAKRKAEVEQKNIARRQEKQRKDAERQAKEEAKRQAEEKARQEAERKKSAEARRQEQKRKEAERKEEAKRQAEEKAISTTHNDDANIPNIGVAIVCSVLFIAVAAVINFFLSYFFNDKGDIAFLLMLFGAAFMINFGVFVRRIWILAILSPLLFCSLYLPSVYLEYQDIVIGDMVEMIKDPFFIGSLFYGVFVGVVTKYFPNFIIEIL